MNRQYLFSGFVSTEKCQQFYRGEIRYVIVTADSGERIQLAFKHFKPFISQLGIRGRFRLTLTNNGDFFSLEKIN
ncbi:DUF2835 domain-containing protein [Rheinheimera sp. UJ51]|uniref:DUF2835 family protein n=1 Tax=unclassified Rheinheimera TaxID=115860 RepID=UPI001E5B7D02|nr:MULTISPECIES: DUF2835 family protein [unclassified Rheinheimera]MCC5451648.1 DUF2835 domain-containing protein [Rheinheimera sp. UJ51]MCF4009734.1 DUF2835 domain-containing protein [Rheinheimera sp. UJ63]